MKLTVAAFLLAVPAVAGRRSHGKLHRGTKAVRPTKGLMRNAKHIGGHKIRHLDQNGGDGNNYNYDEEQDITWMYQYEIRFESCHTAFTIPENDFGGLVANDSIEFTICPSNGGKNCGRYLARMNDFLDMYTESQMEAQEYQCEMAREKCEYEIEYQNQNGQNQNQNYDEDYYMNECYKAMGKDYCVEYENDEFELQEYLECREWEGNQGNMNMYFIGPYCANNGKEVRLGMFSDEGCAVRAQNGLQTYATYSYGRSLPYSDESIVSNDLAISCKQVDQNQQQYNYDEGNNGNNNNNYDGWNQDMDINQFCEELYWKSAKCEKGLNKASSYNWSPDNKACTYMENVLPGIDSSFAAVFGNSYNSGKAAKAFAWIFAITTAALGGYVFYLHKNKERKVDLSSQGDASQA